MMRTFHILLCLPILLASCSKAVTHESATGAIAVSTSTVSGINATAGETKELPLPVVPASMISPKERAAYILDHFWDAMDFGNRSLSLDTAFMEQNFANFASLFDYADSTDLSNSVNKLMERAETDKDVYLLLSEIAEKYLYEPNSPMYDEEHFIMFIRAQTESRQFDESSKERTRYLLETALKNRRGTMASDFRYTDRYGKHTKLLNAVKGQVFTVLIFYDPDCGHCKETIDILRSIDFPSGIKVLAIDAEGDRDHWEASKESLPADWEVGYATDDILGDERYVLPAMPTIYLIDRYGRVVLKDATPVQLVKAIEQHTQQVDLKPRRSVRDIYGD